MTTGPGSEREIGLFFFFFHVSSRPTESFEVDDMTLERRIRSQIPLTGPFRGSMFLIHSLPSFFIS